MTVKCGEYSCRKPGTQISGSIDMGPLPEEDEESRNQRIAQAIRCNFHVGVEKRRTWSRFPKDWTPITDEVGTMAEANYNRIEALRAKSRAEAEASEHQRQREVAVYYWNERASEDEYVIVYSEQREQRIWNILTKEMAESTDPDVIERRTYHREAQVVVDTRDVGYDDVTRPVSVDIHWSSQQTPRLVRVAAEALVKAAEVADAINAQRLIQHQRNVAG